MRESFKLVAAEIVQQADNEGRLIANPSPGHLRWLAFDEPEVVCTKYGSLMAESEPMSRAKMHTKTNIDDSFGIQEDKLLEQAKQALSHERLVSLDVIVGDGSEGVAARLVVPIRFAHVAFAGAKLFTQREITQSRPKHQVIMFFDEAFESNKQKLLPDKDITIRNFLSDDGGLVKYVRNSNYIGEWKKGVFTGEDWRVKLQGHIFLHAGCRMDRLEQARGGYKTKTSLFAALSANGKTSLTCKVLAMKSGEESWLIQDDGGTLKRDGSFMGFEGGGIFVKTDGLSPMDQIETYYGALRPDAFMENVHVEEKGDVDFFNIERTSNGRAVIERRDFMHASTEINAEKVDNLFLITRGNIVPALARLSPEQSVAFMILGQSMESSAGDPTQAGKIKNVFFYDPFMAGDRVAHAKRFYEILKANPHINCYLLNTGGVGEGGRHRDITLQDTLNAMNSVLRGGLTDWTLSEATGLETPVSIRRVDSVLCRPEKLYPSSEFAERKAALDANRRKILESYAGLNKKILKSVLKD